MSPAASGLPWACRQVACGIEVTMSLALEAARSGTLGDIRGGVVSAALALVGGGCRCGGAGPVGFFTGAPRRALLSRLRLGGSDGHGLVQDDAITGTRVQPSRDANLEPVPVASDTASPARHRGCVWPFVGGSHGLEASVSVTK